ncbi:MAG: MarR family winged helix-turn-helix transcriptional regulator [Gaiellales bacterium]
MIDQEFRSAHMQAFAGLLRAHAAATRCFSALLQRGHGLSLSEYEVLLRLARAPDQRLKRVELVSQVLLTPSGITRLLRRLETAGLVEKASCASDARVTYAVLTEAGRAKLDAATRSHVREIHTLLGGEFSKEELSTLAALLARLPQAVENGA